MLLGTEMPVCSWTVVTRPQSRLPWVLAWALMLRRLGILHRGMLGRFRTYPEVHEEQTRLTRQWNRVHSLWLRMREDHHRVTPVRFPGLEAVVRPSHRVVDGMTQVICGVQPIRMTPVC